MPATHVSCPACTQRLSLEVEALRTRMRCPRCGTDFLPIDTIPRQNTLPAMSASQLAAAPPPAAQVDPLSTQAGTILLENPAAVRADPAPPPAFLRAPSRASLPDADPAPPALLRAPSRASLPDVEAPSRAAPAPAPTPPSRAIPEPAHTPPPRTALPPSPPSRAVPEPAPAPAPAPAPPSRASQQAAPPSRPGPTKGGVAATVLDHPPVPRRSSIAVLRATGRATTIEIAMLASSLERAARGRTRRAIGYSHIALALSPVAGLSLIALALSDALAVRIIAGILSAASISLLLAAGAAYALSRWRPRVPESDVSPDAIAAYEAVSGRLTLTTVSRATRVALAGSAVLVLLIAGLSTWRFAQATHLSARGPEVPPAPTDVAADPKPALAPEQRADFKLRRGGHVFVSGGVLHAPPSFRSDDGAYDLVMHFHGNTQLVQESFEAAKINALVYVVNLGIGSGAYEDRYAVPGVFDEALTRIREAAEKRGLRNPRPRRLALSSWSAGYGAIAKILESQKDLSRIDALVMLDGLHVAYLDQKNRTKPDPLRLKHFVRFAKEAAEGKKLFTITHSRIDPRDYASAEQTADEILRAIGAERTPIELAPPKVSLPSTVGVWSKEAERWLRQTSEARRGGLRVRGYVGQTPEDHMAHLVQMSVTVLPELAERWKEAP